MSLLTDPTGALERDTYVSLNLGRLAREQPQQPGARPLSHLSVLVPAPTVLETELSATRFTRELACQHEPLIAR